MILDMPTTARQRVLRHLAQHAGASARQIARALGMKPPAVRHHLSVLRADGRVAVHPRAGKSGRGRRPLSYRISERILGDNLAMVADVLLKARATGPRPRTDRIVQVLAKGLVDRIGALASGASATARLAQLVAAMNALHYHARWEAGAEGPRLLLGHCPYAAIIDSHPELCLMDAGAVSEIMGAQARQTAKIDTKRGDAMHCVLVLKELSGYRQATSSRPAS
jgi:predicted ArsR family transcriptional regulator